MTTSSTPLSDYTTVFRAKTTDSGTVEATSSAPAIDASRRRIRRRNRPAVACEPCRLRKKKCDRQHPCLGCVGRGDTCYYAAAPVPVFSATGAGVGGSGGSVISGPRVGGSISKGHGGAGGGGGSSRYEAQIRLQRLEDMVSELMGRAQGTGSSGSSSGETPETAQSSSSASDPSPASSASPVSTRAGELPSQRLSGVADMAPRASEHLGGSQEGSTPMPFVGATHWSAFLQQIRDLQGYLEHEMADDAPPPAARTSRSPSPRPSSSSGGRLEPDFLVENRGSRVSTDEILDALPPRTECDKLLAAYFCNDFLRAPLLHSVQFQRTYVAFWERPEAASVLWVSMLFSVLYMSSGVEMARQVSRARGEDAVFPPRDMGAWPEIVKLGALRDMATRCLVSGDYLKGPEYAVEALALCSFMRLYSIDGETDPMLWAGVGTAIRLAQHLGYHRDPRHLSSTAAVGSRGQERPALSVFAGEMRRRTWFILEAFDFLLSFRYGVPTVIHGDDTDTEGPTNLIDTDFDEQTTVLPPERPITDPTNMLYICYKSKSIRLARRLVRHTIRQQPHQTQHDQRDAASSPSYQQTMALDAELRAHLDQMPPSLRLVLPISEHAPLTDTPPRIIHRVAADLMYHKSVCVLHRAYLTCGREGTRAADSSVDYSRTACRASALRILKVQAEIEKELRPGGRLHGEDYLLGGIVKHDFLLAATIICLDLVEMSYCPAARLDEQLEKLEVLETSYGFWYSRRHSSRDAAYAVKVLGAIIAKVKRTNKELAGSAGRHWRQQQQQQPPPPPPQLQQQQDSQWLATITSSVPPSVSSSAQAGLVAAAPGTFENNDPMYDLPLDDDFLAINAEDIDWDMIDSFLLDRQSTLDARQDWSTFGPM
ncbi:hypothetical protein MCOR25_000053 [Pyricularia grisea]|nr:hypothetical protein MCOR25_000053 [Pyricularia grisea]